MFTFTPKLEKDSKIPLYQQLYAYIIKEFKEGNIKSGEKLPSKRQLAKDLGISKNTIETTYQHLISEGYIESRQRSGYYTLNIDNLLIIPGNKNVSQEEEVHESYEYDFSTSQIDIESFPKSIWNKLYRETLAHEEELLNLGQSQGDLKLRSEIAHYLHSYRGVNCNEEQIVVGAGFEYLLGLLCCFFKDSNFALEDPGYPKTREILKNYGLKYTYIPVDDYGISLKDLEESDTNICYITPSHQFPSGVIMPIWRRNKILNWAYKNKDRYIIEDDYDSEFRFDRLPIPSLQGLDKNDKVIYMSTFSRSLAPSIRIAYMVLPKKLLKEFKNSFKYYSSTISRFDQMTLASFLEEGYYSRHLNRIRKIYKQKRDALIKALKENFGQKVIIHNAHTGNYLIAEFVLNKDEKELVEIARIKGIKVNSFKEYFENKERYKSRGSKIIFGYGNLKEEEINKAISILKKAWI